MKSIPYGVPSPSDNTAMPICRFHKGRKNSEQLRIAPDRRLLSEMKASLQGLLSRERYPSRDGRNEEGGGLNLLTVLLTHLLTRLKTG